MYTVIAKLKIAAENQDEFKKIGAALIEESLKEEAVISYYLTVSKDDPEQFAVVEIYKDQAGHEFHANTPHVTDMFPKMCALAKEDAVVEFYYEV